MMGPVGIEARDGAQPSNCPRSSSPISIVERLPGRTSQPQNQMATDASIATKRIRSSGWLKGRMGDEFGSRSGRENGNCRNLPRAGSRRSMDPEMNAEKPNILFLVADDLGWGDVGWHGSAIRTPNLDRLAATGLELDQHYVCPVCTPTRASLLTGRYPGRFGPHATQPSNAPVFPDGTMTLAGALRDHGYDTALFGKWHLGSKPEYGPNQFGFNTAYGSLAGGVDPYNHRYKKGKYSVTWHRNGEFVEDHGHITDLITDAAIEWIEKRREPWFCYVPFTAVHFPVKAPQDWLDRYAADSLRSTTRSATAPTGPMPPTPATWTMPSDAWWRPWNASVSAKTP